MRGAFTILVPHFHYKPIFVYGDGIAPVGGWGDGHLATIALGLLLQMGREMTKGRRDYGWIRGLAAASPHCLEFQFEGIVHEMVTMQPAGIQSQQIM